MNAVQVFIGLRHILPDGDDGNDFVDGIKFGCQHRIHDFVLAMLGGQPEGNMLVLAALENLTYTFFQRFGRGPTRILRGGFADQAGGIHFIK